MTMLRISDASTDEITQFVVNQELPRFRTTQILEWVRRHGIYDPEDMSNLPKDIRRALCDAYPTPPMSLEKVQAAKDGTVKLLFKLADGLCIESVLIPSKDRTTVCLSSQVGCAVGCRFCASGIDGGIRNLTCGEIVEQFMFCRRAAGEVGREITNLVMMGMGEPMLNYSPVFEALGRINDEKGPGFGARRITVSTVGIKKGVERFTEAETQYTLAFSLHAPNDEIRREIVPLEAAMSVAEIVAAADTYLATTGREVTFEYVLLAGINDQPEHARQLADLLGEVRGTVNIIPLNPVEELPYQRPTDETIRAFSTILERHRGKVTVRARMGSDIDAACGQLAIRSL